MNNFTTSANRTAGNLQIGKNIITYQDGVLLLQKTRKGKFILIGVDGFLILIMLICYYSIFSSSKFEFTNSIYNWVQYFAIFVLPPGLIIYQIIKTFKENKPFIIQCSNDHLTINNESLGHKDHSLLLIRRNTGQNWIGESYTLTVKSPKGIRSISSGNRLSDAERLASMIADYCGCQIRKNFS